MPYVLLCAACALLFLWGLGSIPLIGLDEGLYAETSREMLHTGDWVVPRCNGELFLDKPPLVYWLQAVSMSLFGVESFSVRLPSAVSALALIALVTWLGGKLFSRRAGLFAGFTLSCTMLTTGLARLAVMDMVFALAITTSLGSFVLGALARQRSTACGLVFWAAMGVSVLVKGPAGAVLILVVVAACAAVRRDSECLRRTEPLPGVVLMLLVAAPWYVLVQRQTGGAFLSEFIIHQNLQRAAGADFNHNMPFWFYLPIFALGFFPWSVWVPLAWRRYVRVRAKEPRASVSLLLGVWAAATVVVFSLSRSKLPAYIFPAWPACALLVGRMWSESDAAQSIRRAGAVAVCCAALLGAALVFAPVCMSGKVEGVDPKLTPALVAMGLSILLGCALGYAALRVKRITAGFALFWAGMAGLLAVASQVGLPLAAEELAVPGASIGREIARRAAKADRTLAYNLSPSQPAISFYAQRPVFETGEASELRRSLEPDGRKLLVLQRDREDGFDRGAELLARSGDLMLYRISHKRPELP